MTFRNKNIFNFFLNLKSYSSLKKTSDEKKRDRNEYQNALNESILKDFKIFFKNDKITSFDEITTLAEMNPKIKNWLTECKRKLSTINEIKTNFGDLDISAEDFQASQASRKRLVNACRQFSEFTAEAARKYDSEYKKLLENRDSEIKKCTPLARILSITRENLTYDQQELLAIKRQMPEFRGDSDKFSEALQVEIRIRQNFLIKKLREKGTLEEKDYFPDFID